MATQGKDYPPPPSYDEAMKCDTFAPTAPHDPSHQAGLVTGSIVNPASAQYTATPTTYGAFETHPLSVELPPPPPGHQPNDPAPQIIIVSGCPACRVGVLEDGYSCLGLLCAIVFFPIGIICCLASKTKRCTNCETEF